MPASLCELCLTSLEGFTADQYLAHMQCHRHVHNHRFLCWKENCPLRFKAYTSLVTHVKRKHCKLYEKEPQQDKSVVSQWAVPENLQLQCEINLCEKVCDSYNDIIKHLKMHLLHGISLSCPFKQCSSVFSRKSSFSSHLSRCHRLNAQSKKVALNVFNQTEQADWSGTETDEGSVYSGTEITCIVEVSCDQEDNNSIACCLDGAPENNADSSTSRVVVERSNEENHVLQSLALCLLALESQHFLPQSTVQFIVDELRHVALADSQMLASRLYEQLEASENFLKKLNKIQESCVFNTAFATGTGCLRSSYARLIYQKNYLYDAPMPSSIGDGAKGDCYVYYIPIKDSLKNMLANKSVEEAIMQQKRTVPYVLNDFVDGLKYKKECSANEIQILLFQDAFEIVNPLGSARKKHKLLAVYDMIGNIPPQYRSSVDSIFLVMLLKEQYLKAFGQQVVFQHLIEDLHDLERYGVYFQDTVVKAKLFALLGDNLGSHAIGGFSESFSTQYFCRYCLINQEQHSEKLYELCERRTQEKYCESLQYLENNPQIKMHKGIKFNSIFNSLQTFHVCDFGLPPCLGHDIFEGVVAYDLALYIQALVAMGWFSHEILNTRITQFAYSGSDLLNKPPILPKSATKLLGHSMENWCFVKLFPLLVHDKIHDFLNPVWQLCLSLKRVVELLCSPSLSQNQIAYMDVLVQDYLYNRSEVFPLKKLKPKHHCMLHYAELTQMLGPLIRLWTMRFESKHSYFKHCIRSFHNYKNVASTLATYHQLHMAYIHSGNILKKDIQYDHGDVLQPTVYATAVQHHLSCANLNASNCVVAYSVKLFGLIYKVGMVLIVHFGTVSKWSFGRILLMLVKDNAVLYFLVQIVNAKYKPEYDAYCIDTTCMEETRLVESSSLLNYYPLSEYCLQERV